MMIQLNLRNIHYLPCLEEVDLKEQLQVAGCRLEVDVAPLQVVHVANTWYSLNSAFLYNLRSKQQNFMQNEIQVIKVWKYYTQSRFLRQFLHPLIIYQQPES